jgi:hypothetical protein
MAKLILRQKAIDDQQLNVNRNNEENQSTSLNNIFDFLLWVILFSNA